MKTRVHSPNLVHILFIIALAIPLAMGGLFPARASALSDPAASLQPASRVYAAEPQTGIDCGCTLTGWYEDPAAPLPLTVQRPEFSPHGKYQVEWDYGSFGQITFLNVKRVGAPTSIISLGALPSSTNWRFSPDDDRFAIYSIETTISGSQTSYYLYNLVRATGAGVPIWDTLTLLVDTEAAFSPHGQYFQYARVDSGMTYLTILDARTGARVYETSFTAAPPPSGSKTRVASWGYSPDTSDRTFVYAYVNSQIVSSVYWGVVNLHLTTNKLVHDELLVNALSSGTIQPFWKFSPCGDAIGLVNTAVTPTNIRLFATSDGTLKGEQNITTGDTLALRNNLASHYADTGSATYTLADNTADAACSVVPGEPGLQALSVSPASVICGTGAQGTVTLSEPAPSGGVVVSLASDTSAAQVPSSIKVLYGNSSANFGITTSDVSTETTAYISAMLGSTTNTAALTLFPSPIASLTMSRYGIIAGATEIGTVTLRDPAPAGGAVVWLYASGSFWTPNLVQVPEGETTATFDVTAWFYVDSPQATLTATYLGASKTIDLTILRASSLAVTPAEVTGGMDTVTLTVDLPGPAPEGGVVVPLSGDPAGIVDLPPSMIIETGQITGSITAGTTAIDEDTDVTILAGMPDDSESPTAVVHVLATIPTALPGGPYLVLAGQPLTLIGTGTDPRGESLTFAWDLDFDETFETAGDTAAFTDTAGQNREVPIGFRACNTSGLCGTALTFVRVRNIGQVWVSGPEPSQDIGMPNNEIGIPDGPTPALVEDFGQVIDVVGGAGFMAALRADGTVWTMGDNFFGQLGDPDPSLPTGWLPDGHRAHSSVPVQAAISDVVAIASKGEHVMALKRDGTVWTWGSNQYLTLGNGTADGNPHPTPTQVENLSGVVAIAASGHGSFALTRKGEIYGWGYGVNIFGRACDDTTFPCRITTIRQAVALQVTSSWAIVLKRDGTVWFWGGYDPVTMEDRLDPEQIEGLSGIAAISASGEKGSIDSTDDALLALKNDGTVWGFGNNANGQLGQDPLIPYPPYLRDYIGPVQIPGLAGTRALAAGEALQSALLQDGTVAGWGLVVHSCPEGCGEYWLPSPLAGLANVLAVAVGDDFRLAIVPGGVPGAPGLAITQVADHETVSTGDEISFTITITNNGDHIASSVTLSDTLPLAIELSWLVDGTDAASCTIAAGIVSCSFGDMTPGAVKTIRLTSPTQFIPGISGKGFCPTISSTATVMASNQPEGSSATASTEVLCPYVITSVWPDTPSVTAGDPVSFTITTGNTGEGVARGVLAETTLPENPGLGWSISNVVPASAAGNCGFSSGPDLELICSFDELAPGQEVTITVTSPTSFGSCGELRSGGTVTYSNGAATKSKVATIIVNSTNCTVSDTVQPGEAATLTLPNGRGQIEFPANLVTAPTTFTYAEQDAPSQALGSYTFAGLSFTLVATDPDGNPVTSFPASYTIRLTYQDSDWQSAGIADESLLNLAYWNTVNGQWMNVLPCEGCSLDTEQNQLVAMLNHLTEFALLASTDTTPVITAQPQSQTADVGDTVSFSAAASGDPAPTVQWQVSTDDGTTWSDITGETASPLTFSASLDQNGNQYRAVFANSAGSATSDAATLTVSTKSASITLSNLTQTYDGQPKPVTVTTDPAGLSVAVTYDGSPSAPTHAGSYPVVATIDDGTYQGSASGTLTIQPKAASVTPDAAGKVYGDADPALTGTLAGFLATDGVTAACSRTAGEAVGDYSVSAVLSPAEMLANYDITYDSAAFTITPRPIQVTADAKTKVAGEPDPLLTYQITGGSLAFSDAFSGALARDPGDEVGVYAIQQGTLVLSSNYTLTYVGADLTIVAASLNTAPVANPARPYLGAINGAISFDGSGSSDADGDALTYAWTSGDGGTATGATPTHSYPAAGLYDVCLTVNDGTVDSDPACTLAVVYDPSAGFVTGGGWIDSPAGAYKLDESLSDKATFGFVSKYKKGASVPEGNTEFQFQAGDLNFHSATYEWLVVAGKSRAQFKGSGTVNGELDPNGNAYKFMLWAGDDAPDTFRIRIWWEADGVENVVYDNGFDQPIGGGSIVVHTSK